jgi:hypothetical protein
MRPYSEERFKERVDDIVGRLRTILQNHRNPTYPADVFHHYDDKFLLVEFLANSTLAGQINCLKVLGMKDEFFETLKQWSNKRSVCF